MLPDGWLRRRLGEYLKESRVTGTDGTVAKKITVKLYGKGVFGKDEKRIGSENTKYFKRKAGQFIYSKLDFLNGAFGIIPKTLDGYESTLDMPSFDSIAEIDLDWLLYHFSRDSFYKSFVGNAAGGRKAKRIQVDEFLNIEIAFPSPPEQRRIAERLRTVDDVIESTKLVIDQTKTVKQGLLQMLLTRGVGHTKFKDSPLGEIPSSWEVMKLGDACEINPRQREKIASDATVGFLGMADISEDGLISNIQSRIYAEVSKGFTNFANSDVLLAKITPCFENGKRARVSGMEGGIGFGSTEFHVLRATSKVLSDYIFLHVSSLKFRQSAMKNMTGSAGQKRVPTNFLKNWQISVPSLLEQQTIVEVFSKIDAQSFAENQKLATLQTLKKGLMDELLNGKVRVAVPADVPARNVAPFTLTSPVEAVRKHAVLSAEITAQLYQLPTFGATKREKVTDLVVRHVGLDETTDRQATRHAAGSYDPKARREIDETFEREKWFSIRRDENAVRFTKGTAFGDHKAEFDEYFGSVKQPIQKVINLLRDYPTQHCEIIDTLYTAWNDFLIDGNTPTETEIIEEVLTNWHDSKQAISRQVWRDGLAWMKARDFVPSGRGRSTKPLALL